jgi:hypothetical protein
VHFGRKQVVQFGCKEVVQFCRKRLVHYRVQIDMIATAGHDSAPRQAADLHRGRAIRHRSVAHLAGAIQAPAPGRPIALDGQTVVASKT